MMKLKYYFNLQLANIWPSVFIMQSMAETNNFTLEAHCYIHLNTENKNVFCLQE